MTAWPLSYYQTAALVVHLSGRHGPEAHHCTSRHLNNSCQRWSPCSVSLQPGELSYGVRCVHWTWSSLALHAEALRGTVYLQHGYYAAQIPGAKHAVSKARMTGRRCLYWSDGHELGHTVRLSRCEACHGPQFCVTERCGGLRYCMSAWGPNLCFG
jgi:hypothetical protein